MFADEHLSIDHRAEDVASCHIAIERSHRQAGQICRAASEADLGNDHDLMSPRRYCDMQTFVQKLTDMGHERGVAVFFELFLLFLIQAVLFCCGIAGVVVLCNADCYRLVRPAGPFRRSIVLRLCFSFHRLLVTTHNTMQVATSPENFLITGASLIYEKNGNLSRSAADAKMKKLIFL